MIIKELCYTAAICTPDLYCRVSHISGSKPRIFLLQMLHGKGCLSVKYTWCHIPMSQFHQMIIFCAVMKSSAKIDLTKLPVSQHFHDIADVLILKMKNFLFFID